MTLSTTLVRPGALLACLLLAPLATAGDHWLDPVGGSDANGGTSPGDAWRTLTHAMNTLGPASPGGPVETLHLLPGTFDAANGETFPIHLREALEVVGTEGFEATTVRGEPDLAVFELRNGASPVQDPTLLRGLTVTDGQTGIHARPGIPGVSLELEQVRLFENGVGLYSDPDFSGGMLELHARELRVRHNGDGLVFRQSAVVDIEDSIFRNNFHSIYSRTSGGAFGSHLELDVRRSYFVGSHYGIFLRPEGTNMSITANIEDTLMIEHDFAISRELANGVVDLQVRRSTLADNTIGIYVLFSTVDPILVEECILAGNGSDLFGNTGVVTLDNTWDSGNPGFVDPDNRDYRLSYGSPCVDLGQAPAGTLDQQGLPRDADGDGDLVRASDLGALELATLSFDEPVTLGQTAELELFGEAGGRSLVLFSRGLPALTPFTNQYGELFLVPGSQRMLGVFPHQPGPGPTAVPFSVPNQAAYLGQTFTFQAVSSSSVAPAGGAYTTTTTFTVE